MQHLKYLILFILSVTICFSATVSYGAYSLDEFGIANVDIPENYISCTRTACDPDLETIITQSGFAGLADWTAKVMEPGKYYIYACDKADLTKCMYLVCETLESPKTRDKLVTHKLAQDYNLYESTAEKSEFLSDMKRAAATESAQWVSEDGVTPYIEYYSSVGEDKIHRYETVYNGNKISLQFSSKKDFTPEEITLHLSILSSVRFGEAVDYTEIKEQITAARQKKLEEETHSGENTKILRYIISASVAFVIVFAVYMAIRSQKKKRNKVIVLREPEVLDDGDNANDE